MKIIIPKQSLPRSQSDKRKWLDPVEFQILDKFQGYEISFISARGMGRRKFSEIVPKIIEVDERFKNALVTNLFSYYR